MWSDQGLTASWNMDGSDQMIIISQIWFEWSRLKVSSPQSMRGTWMGKTLMIIILPTRLDGVGLLLWHEKVFVEHGWVRPNDHHKLNHKSNMASME